MKTRLDTLALCMLLGACASSSGAPTDAAIPSEANVVEAGPTDAEITDRGTPPVDSTPDPSLVTEATCRSYLATNASPAGIPELADGPGGAQRTAFLASGGKLVTLDDRYYALWFPDSYFRSTLPIVVFNLHGTAGYPEAEWNDWHAAFSQKGIAMVSLAWEGGTEPSNSDVSVYDRLKRIHDDLSTHCPIRGAEKALLGFSVGSALSYAIVIRDLQDRKLFKYQIANSGAAWSPITTGRDVMHPTVEASKGLKAAYQGMKTWMYCGEKDVRTQPPNTQWTMCEEAVNAVSFVNGHGGSATVYKDPNGGHASLSKTPAAWGEALRFISAF